MPEPQNLANHARFDPPFHFFMVPVFLITLVAAIVDAIRHPGLGSIWFVVFAAAILVAAFKIRLYALRVQDRVIRLEERLRMMSLLPEPLRGRVPELTTDQCIGLRFACDAELAALAQRALDENLDRKQIKQAVQNWRADHSRI
jgi:hypothetical protein